MSRNKNTVMGFSSDRLDALMKREKYNNKILCEKLLISREATVSEWRNAKKEPSKKHLDDLCKLFGVSVSYFYPSISDDVADAYVKGREAAAELQYDENLRNSDADTWIEQDLLMIDRPHLVYLANFLRSNGFEVSYFAKRKGKTADHSSDFDEEGFELIRQQKSVIQQIKDKKKRLKEKEYEKLQNELIKIIDDPEQASAAKMITEPSYIKEKLKIGRVGILYDYVLKKARERVKDKAPADVYEGVIDKLVHFKDDPLLYQYILEDVIKRIRKDNKDDYWDYAVLQYKKLCAVDPEKDFNGIWKFINMSQIISKMKLIKDYWGQEPFDWKRYEAEISDIESQEILQELDDLTIDKAELDARLGRIKKNYDGIVSNYNQTKDLKDALMELRTGGLYLDEIYNLFEFLVVIKSIDGITHELSFDAFEEYANKLFKHIEDELSEL